MVPDRADNTGMRLYLAALLLLLGSCSTMASVDIASWQRESGLELTQNDAPEGAEALTLVSAHRSGFYLLGVIPLVRADFAHCIAQIVQDAKQAGAEGVAHLRIQYDPPSFFSLVEPVFPWMARATITGMAYRRRRPAR